MRRSCITGLFSAAYLLLFSYGAGAHHSFAMFDQTKEIVIQGTVTQFQWTNPHAWIEMDVPEANGQTTHWSIEAGSIAGLSREGWKRNTIQAGDKVQLVARPMRDGKPGGSLMGITLADGRHLGASLEAPKPAN